MILQPPQCVNKRAPTAASEQQRLHALVQRLERNQGNVDAWAVEQDLDGTIEVREVDAAREEANFFAQMRKPTTNGVEYICNTQAREWLSGMAAVLSAERGREHTVYGSETCGIGCREDKMAHWAKQQHVRREEKEAQLQASNNARERAP